MAEALAGAFDLGAIVVVLWIIALLILATIVIGLLFKPLYVIADAVDSVNPFGNPAHDAVAAAQDAIIDGLDSARSASEGVVRDLWSGLIDAFGMLIAIPALLALGAKAAFVYMWDHAVKPWAETLVKPIRALAEKADAAVASVAKTVAADFTKAEAYAEGQAAKAITTTEAFTRTEVSAARADAAAASSFITARLDGIGTQAASIAGDVAAAPGIVWDDLKKYLDVKNLADATLLGMLGALGIHALTNATGMDSSDCQQNQKAVCGADTGQWLKLLEGIALLGVTFDFKLLYDFAETIIGDVGDLVVKIEDVAWSEFGG